MNCDIFAYELPNGDRQFADPLRIRRRLVLETNGKIHDLIKHQGSEELGTRLKADETLAKATAASFELPMLDEKTGEGLTEEFFLDLLDKFQDWLDEQKKNT